MFGEASSKDNMHAPVRSTIVMICLLSRTELRAHLLFDPEWA